MKKIKGVNKAIEKFNSCNTTARIFLDIPANRIECRTYLFDDEGRFEHFKEAEVQIHNKEIPYEFVEKGEIPDGILPVTEQEIIDKCSVEIEEYNLRNQY